MADSHPETEIIPYLRGELPAPDRERVARHLDSCPDCRELAQTAREIFDALARAAPAPPPLSPARYRAEVRARLQGVRTGGRRRWLRPLPLGLSAAVAGLVLALALSSWVREPGSTSDLGRFEEAALGQRLEIVERASLLERLDLLEDMDVIGQLDRLSATREG